MSLSRNYIRSLAIDEDAYTDGFAYYKNGRVTHAQASADRKSFRFDVKGNYSYKVIVNLAESGDEVEYSCTCPAHVKHKGACKHVIAALLFLNQYVFKNSIKKEMSEEDYRCSQILDYYSDLETLISQTEVAHIEAEFFHKGTLRNKTDIIPMRLSIGTEKYYKIQSVRKMIESIEGRQNISFGKGFSYRYGVTEFDRSSENLYQYLLGIYEMENQYGIVGERSVFQKNEVNLTKRMFLEVLKRIGKDAFSMTFANGKSFQNIHFIKGNPMITYDIDSIDDIVTLNYADRGRVFPLSSEGDLLYYDRNIYAPKTSFIRNYLPIYNSLGKDNEPIVFRKDNANRFLEEVLPRLSATMNLQIPEAIRDRYVEYPLQASFYLEYQHSNIRGELKFSYGEYTFNSFEDPSTDGVIILRDKDKENAIFNLLDDLHFEMHQGYYMMRDEEAIFEFLSGDSDRLIPMMQLFYDESFRRLRIRKDTRVSYGIHAKKGEDYLSLEIGLEDVDKDELRDLLQSVQLKKKFFRLKDGNFLLLDDENLLEAIAMIHSVNGSVRQLKDATVSFAKYNLPYLEEVLQKKNGKLPMDDDVLELLEELKNPAEIPAPEGIHADIRPYQMYGFRWMSNLMAHHMGGILADDMGLGKTLQSITFLMSLPKKEASIVICPSSLMYNWKDEIENFAPDLTSIVICGTPEERMNMIQTSEAKVLITSYPLLRRDLSYYKKRHYEAIIIDEAQNIKNPASINASSVKQLEADCRFALTGTPIENSLTEIWSIFDFLMPNYMYSHAVFMNQYEKPIANHNEDKLFMLHARMKPFILRRMKQDVLKELPDKTEEKILIELSEDQKKLYAAYLNHYRGEFDFDDEEVMKHSQMQILSALMRLRQICCHPKTFIENYEGESAKLDVLRNLTKEALGNGHRILIFSQFTSMLSLIKDMLVEEGISYYIIEGETKLTERSESVKAFNEGNKDVFLISLKAGGTGLNLVGADTVIHVDPWWNPAVEEQATDRAYRIGQTKNVHVIKLLAKDTIEEKIYRLQKKKQHLADSVIDPNADLGSRLSREELLEIFSDTF